VRDVEIIKLKVFCRQACSGKAKRDFLDRGRLVLAVPSQQLRWSSAAAESSKRMILSVKTRDLLTAAASIRQIFLYRRGLFRA
jgi:hypothetical protein